MKIKLSKSQWELIGKKAGWVNQDVESEKLLTFYQIEEKGGKEHVHHWRKTCVRCGDVETCRCSAPKVDVKGICPCCCEKEGIDFLTGIRKVAENNGKMTRLAVSDGEFRDAKSSIKKVKDDIRDVKRDIKDFDGRMKKVEKAIDSLNIGARRFWQEKTVFTSLQRKIERLETLEQEWKKYKEDMDRDIRSKVEKSMRARVKYLSPSK